MKSRPQHAPLTLAVLAASCVITAAAVPITDTTTYTQNFDTALTTGSVDWVDDTLIPGWFAQINNGATASGTVQAADGSAVLSGLLNCGTVAATDRALGSKATGTGNLANISYAVSFQNTSTNPIQWSGLRYTGECWLTNSTAAGTTAETWTTYYQVSNTAITDIISGPSAAAAAAGAGFTALGATGNWTSPKPGPAATALDGNAAGNFTVVTHTASPPIILQPGQFLTIKWTDTNLGGTDGFQAIDDVSVDFTKLDASVIATRGARTRDFNGTPTNLADDTFGVSVAINGSGAVTSWTAPAASPPATNVTAGSYGTTAVWTGFPVSGPKNITVSDVTNAAFNVPLTIPPLAVIGSDDTVVTGTPILHEDVYFSGWTATDATRTLTQTANTTQTDFVVNSQIIDLSTTGFVQFKGELDAITGGSSGFEPPDHFALQLIIDGAAPISVLGDTNDLNKDGLLTGLDGAGTELPGTTDTNRTKKFFFSHIVPDTANTLQIRIIGNSNSPAETYRVSNIKLVPPPGTVLATAGISTFDNRGTADPADDQYSTPVTITPVSLPGSPGWNSNVLTVDPLAGPASGAYSPPATTFGPFSVSGGPRTITIADQTNAFVTAQVTLQVPPAASITVAAPTNITREPNGPGPADDTVTFQTSITGASNGPTWTATGGATPATGFYGAGPMTFTIPAPLPGSPVTIVFTDVSYPTATQSIAVAFPSIYTIGQTDFASVQSFYSLPVTAPDTAWVNDATARTLTMTDGDAPGVGIKTITSEVVSLGSVTGDVRFSANLHVRDLTRGFETTDTFNAYLILDGNTITPVSLITPHDDNADGLLSGDDLCPIPAAAGNVTQDFDYPLSAIIPDAVNTVQLVIEGINDSANEFMTVGSVRLALAPVTSDTDGDGISNVDEEIMGTDPASASSVLRISPNAANPLQMDYPTVNGRFYRVYISDDATPATHLQTWTDAGLGTVTGDGNTASFTVTPTPGNNRRYYRLYVKQTDADWP